MNKKVTTLVVDRENSKSASLFLPSSPIKIIRKKAILKGILKRPKEPSSSKAASDIQKRQPSLLVWKHSRARKGRRRSAPLNPVRSASPLHEKHGCSAQILCKKLLHTNVLLAKRLENLKMKHTNTCIDTHRLQRELLTVRTEISMLKQVSKGPKSPLDVGV